MNNLINTAIFSLTLAMSAEAQLVQPNWLTLPQNSVATTDDALAVLVNPAGLAIGDGPGAYFLAPYQSDGHFEDWGIVVGDNFGFAAEAYRHDATGTRRRYTWGLGFGGDETSFGFNYSWTTGIDRQNTWDFGVLERPWSFMSVGAVARGINHPRLNGEKLPVAWDLGIGLRPLEFVPHEWAQPVERLTFTLDAKLRKFDERPNQASQKYFDEIDYTFGFRSEIIQGITAHFDYSPEIKGVLAHDSRLSAGFTFSFGEIETGAFQQSGNGSGSAFIAHNEDGDSKWFGRCAKKHIIIERHNSNDDDDEKNPAITIGE